MISKPKSGEFYEAINVKVSYCTDEPYILANQATHIFFLEDTIAGKPYWRVLKQFEQSNSFNKVAQPDDSYTTTNVVCAIDVYDMLEVKHTYEIGEKIVYRRVQVYELIKKKPTFKDIDRENSY